MTKWAKAYAYASSKHWNAPMLIDIRRIIRNIKNVYQFLYYTWTLSSVEWWQYLRLKLHFKWCIRFSYSFVALILNKRAISKNVLFYKRFFLYQIILSSWSCSQNNKQNTGIKMNPFILECFAEKGGHIETDPVAFKDNVFFSIFLKLFFTPFFHPCSIINPAY